MAFVVVMSVEAFVLANTLTFSCYALSVGLLFIQVSLKDWNETQVW